MAGGVSDDSCGVCGWLAEVSVPEASRCGWDAVFGCCAAIDGELVVPGGPVSVVLGCGRVPGVVGPGAVATGEPPLAGAGVATGPGTACGAAAEY